MCGRFVYEIDGKLIESRYEIHGMEQFLVEWNRPRYNCAPMSRQLVVIGTPEGRVVRDMQWWLVPPMVDDPKAFMARYSTFNARKDKLATSPFYKASLKLRRCVVPVSGFYEWQHADPGTKGSKKTPFYIYPADGEDKLWSLAGIWARWEREGHEPIESFAIVTVPGNPMMAWIHNARADDPRMPAILSDESVRAWLDPELQDTDALLELLQTYPEARMQAHSVRSFGREDSPMLIQPEHAGLRLTGDGDLF